MQNYTIFCDAQDNRTVSYEFLIGLCLLAAEQVDLVGYRVDGGALINMTPGQVVDNANGMLFYVRRV